MLSTGLYGGGQGAQVVPSWMLPEDRSTWGRPQQATLPQTSPQSQQMLPAQFQSQAQQPQMQQLSWGQPQQPAQQPQAQNPYIQPVQPKPFTPDMGASQGSNPLYTQQQPQQPQDAGRWQRAQQLFNTPGYTNDPGFGGSAADQAKARQQNQQIAQNMFPQIYGNNGYGQWQLDNAKPFVPNSPWQAQYAQQQGWMGAQQPITNSFGMKGSPVNSLSLNSSQGQGQSWGGFPQMNPQIQQILQLLMNYTPQNLQMALANGQFAIPGYTNPTPGKVNPMFMY